MRKPVVHLYTVCWDEADMLGFFFRHYDSVVDRYVVYDDGSTDGSREILRAHPRVELRDFARTDPDSFVLSHRTMQNEAWKESRHRADWVVITAIDEHLHVPGRAMGDYLAEAADRGVTLIPALGFDLNHPDMPDDAGLLTERVTRGRPRVAFNKLSVFKPEALRETGFGPGRHAASPEGDLVLPPEDDLVLWHYKHLGFERNATREAAQAERLGRTDRAEGLGQHYLWGRERLRGFWDEMERDSLALATAAPGPLAIRPLWWEEQGLRRADPAPLAPLPPTVPAAPGGAPTVSVLVKSYQHAPYVRQTIESVLAQSFQDFEIVVTDDGSTDGTAEILRSFDDPRIRLECRPVNEGISQAMNATVARARGRYLAILNSDDWALPGRLRRQVGFLDANPQVGLVFGLPRAVDEAGLPGRANNDFSVPLRWPDLSRRTWLSQLFHGNHLCAPTAMIRREAYAAAGAYDPCLTNLQDLDMWVRMLAAGFAIHVLPEALTAFRIRDNLANMSASRPDVIRRDRIEMIRVLHRFAAFDAALFEEVFGGDADPSDPRDPVPLRVAALCTGVGNVAYHHAAVGLLAAHAARPEDYRRLRDLSGTLDALNVQAVADRDRRIAGLETEVGRHLGALAGLRQDLADVHRALGDAHRADAQARLEIRELDAAHTRAVASLRRMRASPYWRLTAPLRAIERALRAVTRGKSSGTATPNE